MKPKYTAEVTRGALTDTEQGPAIKAAIKTLGLGALVDHFLLYAVVYAKKLGLAGEIANVTSDPRDPSDAEPLEHDGARLGQPRALAGAVRVPGAAQAAEATPRDRRAWLFVHAPELTEVPADLPPGPYREAVELANEATFTQAELDAYRKVMDEIQQAREYGEAKWAQGKAEGKAEAVLAVLETRGIAVDGETRTRVVGCTDASTLARWLARAVTAASAAEVIGADS